MNQVKTQHRSFTLECMVHTFTPRDNLGPRLDLVKVIPNEIERCRKLWIEVGTGFWTARSRWGDSRWKRHLCRKEVSFYAASLKGIDAGCFELTEMVKGVKLEGFGLLPGFRGKGLGSELLNRATEQAFSGGKNKVWLHTATDDHPHALPNYLAAGYRIVRERELKNPIHLHAWGFR